MDFTVFCLLVATGIGIFTSNVNAQGMMTAADPMKTCVSVRLPWQPDPMYFCIEKDKFKYKNHCVNKNMVYCGTNHMRNDTLMVVTPWDCCPTVSVPDHCMNMNCPPPPMNRNCKTLDNNNDNMMMNYANSWDCCSKYFCEENMMPENCPMKRLEPMCTNPPQGKMNCVGFMDPFGCCTKYQCDGEGKPGMCPMQHQAMQMLMRFNSSHQNMMNNMNMSMGMGMGMGMNNMPPMNMGTRSNRMSGSAGNSVPHAAYINEEAEIQNSKPAMPMRYSPRQFYATMSTPMMMMNNMQCIHDTNCPGNKKCCSNDMSVYGDGRYMMKSMRPTNGYCVDPIMMAMVPAAAPS